MESTVKQAMGIIETRGYVPLVTAVDAALKAAQVALATFRPVGGGLVNATVTGDVAAVTAALGAAGAVITLMEAQGMTHVIARPDAAVWKMLAEDGLKAPPGGGDGNGGSGPAKGADGALAVRGEAEVPAVRGGAEVPAVRNDSEVPAVRDQAAPPMVQAAPASKGVAAEKPAAKPTPKAAPKAGKKPRKANKKPTGSVK